MLRTFATACLLAALAPLAAAAPVPTLQVFLDSTSLEPGVPATLTVTLATFGAGNAPRSTGWHLVVRFNKAGAPVVTDGDVDANGQLAFEATTPARGTPVVVSMQRDPAYGSEAGEDAIPFGPGREAPVDPSLNPFARFAHGVRREWATGTFAFWGGVVLLATAVVPAIAVGVAQGARARAYARAASGGFAHEVRLGGPAGDPLEPVPAETILAAWRDGLLADPEIAPFVSARRLHGTTVRSVDHGFAATIRATRMDPQRGPVEADLVHDVNGVHEVTHERARRGHAVGSSLPPDEARARLEDAIAGAHRLAQEWGALQDPSASGSIRVVPSCVVRVAVPRGGKRRKQFALHAVGTKEDWVVASEKVPTHPPAMRLPLARWLRTLASTSILTLGGVALLFWWTRLAG